MSKKIDQYIDEAIQSFEKTAKNAKVAKIIHRPYYDEGELYTNREPKPKPLILLTAKRVVLPKKLKLKPLKIRPPPLTQIDIIEPSKTKGHNYRSSNYLNFTRPELITAIRDAEGYTTPNINKWRKDDLLKHYMKLYK